MNYRSISNLSDTIANNLWKLPKDIDLIVGIPRSGLMAASILALHLNLPLTDIDGFIAGRIFGHGISRKTKNENLDISRMNRVLVVDDSVYSGAEMKRVRETIKNKYTGSADVMFMAIYATEEMKCSIDTYFEIVSSPRVFEWNIMHHSFIYESCIDIDGVLCVDPTPEQNDDGDKYLDFVRNAVPMHLPSREVGWLVTCRLEKYRKETELWLAQHNIKYRHLIMWDLPSMRERQLRGGHAQYKAEVYHSTYAKLFIESSISQANVISKLTNKPVFCVENRMLIQPNILTNISAYSRFRFARFFRKRISRVFG